MVRKGTGKEVEVNRKIKGNARLRRRRVVRCGIRKEENKREEEEKGKTKGKGKREWRETEKEKQRRA